MNVNYLNLTGIVLIIIGAVMGTITGLEQSYIVEIALVAFGAALSIISKVKESTATKDWKFYTTIGCLIVGAIIAAVGGMTEQVVTLIIGAVVALGGIILIYVFKK